MKLSQMPPPPLPLTGLELTPLLRGGGADSNVGLPLLAYGQLPRGNVLVLRVPMLADLSATSDSDPGAGKIRWNHATPGSASTLYIDDSTTASGDLSALWATLHVDGFVYVQGAANSEARDNFQKWAITSVDDGDGYGKVGVALLASSGTFVDGDVLELTLQQSSPASGTGDVMGPSSSVANRLALFDGITGKLLKDGGKTIPQMRLQSLVIACSDEATNITAGTAKATFRMPYAFTVTEVRASLSVAQTAGSVLTFDINENGASILSTKLTIDNNEKTSVTAATPPVISDASLADDSEITIDFDQVGTPLAKGVKITLIGYPT